MTLFKKKKKEKMHLSDENILKKYSRALQTIALGELGGTMGNVDRLSEAIAGLEGEGTMGKGAQKQKT